MGILTEDMKRVVREQQLGFIATVCPDGTPNLSPKGTTRTWGEDHLIFADIASPGTVANLRQNPAIEINVVDPFVRKGYRFKGTATVITEGPQFEAMVAYFRSVNVSSPIRSVVLVKVEQALPLISPAYDNGATEAEVREKWERNYSSIRPLSGKKEKRRLITQLDEARERVIRLIAGLDGHWEFYPGWTVKELLAHMTGWDEATSDSLRAYAEGRESAIAAYRGIDEYNSRSVATRTNLLYDRIRREWEQAREELKTVIRDMPDEKFTGEVLYPWGQRGPLSALVDVIIEHEHEHVEEIEKLKDAADPAEPQSHLRSQRPAD